MPIRRSVVFNSWLYRWDTLGSLVDCIARMQRDNWRERHECTRARKVLSFVSLVVVMGC